MDQYIIIFRHEDGSKIASTGQMQQWMQQTMQWINQIAAQNKFVDGKGLLFDQARVVHGGGNVTEGAFGNTAETLGGFVIVLAESIEEATGFAKDCPVLQGEGNSVEVRRLAQ